MTAQEMLDAVSNGVRDSIQEIVEFLPNVLGAAIIIIVGLLVAAILRKAVKDILTLAKVEDLVQKSGIGVLLEKAQTKLTVTEAVGTVAYWVTAIVFLLPAAEVLDLQSVQDLLNQILAYVDNAVIAALVIFFGSIVADLAASVVRGSTALAGVKSAKTLGNVVKYIVVVFAVLLALVQLDIASGFINIMLTGFVAMLAIAGGLAFGLGGKDTAGKIVENVYDKLSK